MNMFLSEKLDKIYEEQGISAESITEMINALGYNVSSKIKEGDSVKYKLFPIVKQTDNIWREWSAKHGFNELGQNYFFDHYIVPRMVKFDGGKEYFGIIEKEK